MSSICIVGLPTSLLKRLKALAERNELVLSNVLAAIGEQGSFRLMPHPDHAVEYVRTYADSLGQYSDGKFLLLPYTLVPDELQTELDCLEHEFNASVERAIAGADGWPKGSPGKYDEAFHEQLFEALSQWLFPGGIPQELSPSAYFDALANRHENVLIPEGSLDSCDEVAKHRYSFMRSAADAIEKLVVQGSQGRIDAFFSALGLKHAQSGGINAALEVYRKMQCIHKGSTQTHLKQGDNTTKIAAARIYYYQFSIGDCSYVAVLYAGPHPENDVSRTHHLE